MRQTICALRPTFEKLFTVSKVQCKAQKTGAKDRHGAQKTGPECKTVYEIDPWVNFINNRIWHLSFMKLTPGQNILKTALSLLS